MDENGETPYVSEELTLPLHPQTQCFLFNVQHFCSCDCRRWVIFYGKPHFTIKSLKYKIKMVDSEQVYCDLLCFLKSKNGKVAVKPLKSSIMDFYKVEDTVVAKHHLINDVERLQLVQLLHIPDRRAGDDRASRVIDDISTVFTSGM